MNNARGSILIITVAFVLVFALFGMGGMYLGTVNNEAAEQRIASTKAFWLAEAGIQKSLWAVKSKRFDDGFVDEKTKTPCTPDGTNCSSKKLSITIDSDRHSDVIVNKNNSLATSTGVVQLTSQTVKRTVQLNSGSPFSQVPYAIFAKGDVVLDNNGLTVDSYRSDSTKSNKDAYKASQAENGDIGTNGTGVIDTHPNPYNVILQGNPTVPVTIKGDVGTSGGLITNIIGTTIDPKTNISISGSITYDNPEIVLPPVIVPSSLVNLSPSPNIFLSNQSTKLKEGDYKFASVKMLAKSTLHIQGNVRLYLTGNGDTSLQIDSSNLVIDSGASLTIYADKQVIGTAAKINNSNPPKNFLLYSTYTSPSDTNGISITMNNGVDQEFSGAIYAPETNVAFTSDTSVYGAVIGKKVLASLNSFLHRDEMLVEDNTTIDSSAALWQEL